jgi:DNA-binding MarR family transcriptional regulator
LLCDLALAGRQLSTATIMFHQAVADRLDLNLTDHKCVDLLLVNGPLTAGELANKTALTTGAITAALDRLEQAGFVEREPDPEDRRRVVVHPVAQRVAAIGQLFEAFSAKFTALAAHYKSEELATIVDFMSRSCTALQESALELREGSSAKSKKQSARVKGKR